MLVMQRLLNLLNFVCGFNCICLVGGFAIEPLENLNAFLSDSNVKSFPLEGKSLPPSNSPTAVTSTGI
jgi:hypothetical protein